MNQHNFVFKIFEENWDFLHFTYVLDIKINMVKIIIITLGESGVGKTSFLNRFKTGKFKDSVRSTFVDHFSKPITVENIKTNAIIWDTAGQERYNSLIKRYYAMADGVLLMYDVSDALTFSKLSRWLRELRSENDEAEIIIVGNKNEDPTKKLVSESEVQDFIEKENLQHIEASAKTGKNVDLIFQSIAKKILIARGLLPPPLEHHHNPKGSTKSSKKKNEPEISFTYYGKSEKTGNLKLEDASTQESIDEDVASTGCFPCRWL